MKLCVGIIHEPIKRLGRYFLRGNGNSLTAGFMATFQAADNSSHHPTKLLFNLLFGATNKTHHENVRKFLSIYFLLCYHLSSSHMSTICG